MDYHFGIDGISLVLILLTTLMGVIAVVCSYTAITERQKEYYVLLLLLQTFMIGTFCCLDFFLFYVFWEVMLVPMYFLIGVWGGDRRLYAAIKFFLYTLAGSVLMLLGIIALYFYNTTGFLGYKGLGNAPTFSIEKLTAVAAGHAGGAPDLALLRLLLRLRDQGADVPVPHVAARRPYRGADGGLGHPRGGPPEDGDVRLRPVLAADVPRRDHDRLGPRRSMVTLSIVGIVYGAMVTLVQKDMKKLIAYSSVSHLGFVMLGVFALNMAGVQGGILQMVNHGISTGALFLLVGIVYERRHTRMISEYGGLARQMPIYATYFMIMALSSMGLPLLNGFIGEFTILQGAFARSFWWAFFAATGHRARRGVPALALPARLLRRDHEPGQREAAGPDAARAADARPARRRWRSGSASTRKPIFDVLRAPVREDRAGRRRQDDAEPGARPRTPAGRRRGAGGSRARRDVPRPPTGSSSRRSSS